MGPFHHAPLNVSDIARLCESFPGVSCYFPFGDEPACYRVGGTIFAQVFPTGVPGALQLLLKDESIPRAHIKPMITLRCQPETGDFWRMQFPTAVLPPYHTPRPRQHYGFTALPLELPGDVIQDMVRHSYDTIVGRLSGKKRRELGL